ncbi:hypothetical protein [Dyadobacter bucti]|uniref:hypothetical protein n=1 Tax=Dyadobacter bucti TaxID=2572203 RepID=UPI003F6E88C6
MDFSKKKPKSKLETSLARKKASVSDLTDNFKVSFQYLDSSQRCGSTFCDWQKDGLLSRALDLLQGYCCRPLIAQVDGEKFTIYGDFPASDRTLFTFPKNVPEDAKWARIHVNGRSILVGHVVNNTFYVVFLDKFHAFYLTAIRRQQLGMKKR